MENNSFIEVDTSADPNVYQNQQYACDNGGTLNVLGRTYSNTDYSTIDYHWNNCQIDAALSQGELLYGITPRGGHELFSATALSIVTDAGIRLSIEGRYGRHPVNSIAANPNASENQWLTIDFSFTREQRMQNGLPSNGLPQK